MPDTELKPPDAVIDALLVGAEELAELRRVEAKAQAAMQLEADNAWRPVWQPFVEAVLRVVPPALRPWINWNEDEHRKQAARGRERCTVTMRLHSVNVRLECPGCDPVRFEACRTNDGTIRVDRGFIAVPAKETSGRHFSTITLALAVAREAWLEDAQVPL